MKLNKIVHQLNPHDFSKLSTQLKENKADKFLLLLNYYREENKESEIELQERLDVKQSAFYTLKSRLVDKIQEFLYHNTADTRIELLQNVANIEHLVYQTQRETAITILKKLEKELIEHDMPNELIRVYKALKKLHIHSDKYYEYLKLYNKYIAFNLAHDKAGQVLSIFCKTLEEYYLNKNSETLSVLILYKKELTNICRLYQSHHLEIYKNILFVHFALFCPVESEMTNDPTIEDLLKESLSIIEKHPEDRTYKHLKNTIHFLYFEYYHKLKLHKDASKYFDYIYNSLECLLLLDHSCFANHFFISKIEHFIYEKKEAELISQEEIYLFDPDKNNLYSYIYFHFYKASAEFYSKKYSDALQTLNSLINEISFKNYSFPEMETKAFIALLNILCEKHDQAEINIRSISRKITDEDNEIKNRCACIFLKLLKTSTSPKNNGKYEKLIEISNLLLSINNGNNAFLPFIKFDEQTLKMLAK